MRPVYNGTRSVSVVLGVSKFRQIEQLLSLDVESDVSAQPRLKSQVLSGCAEMLKLRMVSKESPLNASPVNQTFNTSAALALINETNCPRIMSGHGKGRHQTATRAQVSISIQRPHTFCIPASPCAWTAPSPLPCQQGRSWGPRHLGDRSPPSDTPARSKSDRAAKPWCKTNAEQAQLAWANKQRTRPNK